MNLFFVTPWFSVNSGGAEKAVRELALTALGRGHKARVLTTTLGNPALGIQETCPPGRQEIEGLRIERFRPAISDPDQLASLRNRVERMEPLTEEEQREYVRLNVSSSDLEKVISSDQESLFLFAPYLYGTTVRGLPLAAKSILIPCLHDEPAARLLPMRETFRSTRAALFLSLPERDLFTELYGSPQDHAVIGCPISPPETAPDPERFRKKMGIEGDYLFCCGRRHPDKGIPDLVLDYAHYYHERGPATPRLVIAGPGDRFDTRPDTDGVLDVGWLDETTKWDALAGCRVCIQPSRLESFSIAIMEAWLCERPVLVREDCIVTLHHVKTSDGGLWYRAWPEFAGCLDYLLGNPREADRMGLQGGQYAKIQTAPDLVGSRFETFLESFSRYSES